MLNTDLEEDLFRVKKLQFKLKEQFTKGEFVLIIVPEAQLKNVFETMKRAFKGISGVQCLLIEPGTPFKFTTSNDLLIMVATETPKRSIVGLPSTAAFLSKYVLAAEPHDSFMWIRNKELETGTSISLNGLVALLTPDK